MIVVTDKSPLTQRQELILRFVQLYLEKNQMPPTRVEIANHFHFKSPSAAQWHLKGLERKGKLKLLPIARGIKLL